MPVKVLCTGALIQRLNASLLFIAADEGEKTKALSDFNCLVPDLSLSLQKHCHAFVKNSYIILDKIQKNEPFYLVCTLEQALKKFPAPDILSGEKFKLRAGSVYARKLIIEKLVNLGMEKVNTIDAENQFAFRGELLDISSPSVLLRIVFNDETCENIFHLDEHGNSLEELQHVTLFPHTLPCTASFMDYLNAAPNCLVVLNEEETLRALAVERGEAETYAELHNTLLKFRTLYFSFIHHRNKTEKFCLFKSQPAEFFYGKVSKFRHEIRYLEKAGSRIFIFSKEGHSLTQHFLDENHTVVFQEKADLKTRTTQVFQKELSSGFFLPEMKIAFFSDREIFTRPSSGQKTKGAPRHDVDFSPGDYVVHIQSGIGKFAGLTTLERNGLLSEYACVHYAGGDKIYVPLDQMDRLQKYINADESPPKLSRLSSSSWEAAKRRVKQKARDAAQELLHLYSVRDYVTGFSHEKDTDMQKQLEVDFEFEETSGQTSAITDVKRDMESVHVMDRLICGDVGYGKTEVALRAAFKAVMSGKQACLLAPTTVLSFQHFSVFNKRFQSFPVNVALLTRFQTKNEQIKILAGLMEGNVDVCIGTHRLLQKDVHFRDLGILIIDEEQRFGVMQKETFKSLRKSVDVLTLTATPIPRTLYMSLVGIRDISLIETPPPDRLSIKTEVAEVDDELIQKAIQFEMDRGGQVFYVHNNIFEMDMQVKKLKKLVPSAKILAVHGRLSGKDLENHMLKFVSGKTHILVSTTVIENGLDIPNANTLIVNNADKFGLAQLYQLRGRVGRSNRQAYAYFLYHSKALLSPVPRERLSALKEFADLGSGYELAKRDLEIRGAGNLLGEEQSGFMEQVGFTLYCELLQQAVSELKGEITEPDEHPTIDFPFPAYIPHSLVENDEKRLYYYRRLSLALHLDEVLAMKEKVAAGAIDFPVEFENLLEFVKIKLAAKECGVVQIQRKNENVKIRYRDGFGKIVSLHRNLLVKDAHPYGDALRKIFNEIKELKTRKENVNAKEVCVSL